MYVYSTHQLPHSDTYEVPGGKGVSFI